MKADTTMEEAVLNTGDTAWMLISTGLVVLMIPGIALFYGGMVRVKSALNMMMMSFAAIGVTTIIWVLYGYSLAFGKSHGGLIGGFELLVDVNDYKKLISVNWLVPKAKFWTRVNSTSNYFEQNLRAMLDLPLGSTQMINQFTVTGSLVTDPKSDNYRPYLHLMARNPNLKFDQSINQVAVSGDNLENLLTEVIHAQQYFSGEIEE